MAGVDVAVVSGILKIVGNKLAPLIIKKYSSMVGVKKDLQELQDLVEEINYWLETIGDKAMGSGPSLNWLKQLKDVSYDVDDVVDEFQLKTEKHDACGDGSIVSKYLCTKPKSLIFQCNAAKKIEAIKRRFAVIVKQRTDFSAIANSLPVGHPFSDMNETTANMPSLPIVDVASVLGREQEKRQIISKLVETNDQQTIKIVSVIGLGGSGKTTLAKLIFNDGNIIEKHFEVRLWVHVSQELDDAKLVEKMFEAIAGEKSERRPLQHMSKTILDKLIGKRYLLVLDDVWTEDRIQWEQIMVHLKSGTSGSRILITTRSRRVAEAVESADLHNLQFLSEIDSWQVFEQSFGMAAKGLDSEFLEVGKDIVKKCGGVPLAIKVLAAALRSKERIEEWQAMRDNNLLDVMDEERKVFACLRLSYLYLPPHLKQCLTICSLFPKGHRIDKEQLIDQWIAHDMITPVVGVDYLEYTGHKYFNSLVQVFFLQDVNEYDGRVICRMHDLVHDLAQSITDIFVPAEETSSAKSYRYFSLTEQARNLPTKNPFKKARAIYFGKGGGRIFGNSLKDARHLRSITIESFFEAEVPPALFQVKYLKYLKISELRCEALPEAISDIWSLQALHVTFSDLLELPKSIVLPNSVGKNEELRLLRLGRTKIERLPSSITAVRNLECLDLHECRELVELPEGIGNLEKLQVLNLKGCKNLRGMPVGIRQLSRLQKLGLFVVGKGEKFAQISELANVAGIGEELTITCIAHMMDSDDAHKAHLKLKTYIQRLELNWWRNDWEEVNTEMEQTILDGLEPPSAIKELHIGGYAGGRYAQWMLKQVGGGVQRVPQFTCLTTMRLSGFPNLKHLEGLVELLCLEEFELRSMHALERISGGLFTSLVKLVMWDLPNLREVWMVTVRTLGDDEEGQLQIGTYLSDLSIEGCSKLMVKPCFPSSLERLSLKRSNEQLMESLDQGQGSSSSSTFPTYISFSHLKKLKLSSASPGLGSEHGWELLRHMTALESLEIDCEDGLTELPESMRSLTCLRTLWINGCSNLYMLPEWLGELPSLQKIIIYVCQSLSSLPQSMGQLRSLREVSIGDCRSLSSLPQSMCHLTSLQELEISNCEALDQLPEWLGELRSLRVFRIGRLPGVTCLPQSMCRLTCLGKLHIFHCPGIKSLPESIKGLTALQFLSIYGCPDLKRRCERGMGEDWHLISHIPQLWIR
ncbi:putative disease resistance protein RGA1 isoform X2 [Phragmites australis]|uniref:putative disease resistance protein RGA1 isoform X2 n=1 Tax=Phragmites australis TaxID=29695 RepID=UPI002D77E6E1|nr:putative disease resistance protein RGA1 isoform X2 [Phragmites australis]